MSRLRRIGTRIALAASLMCGCASRTFPLDEVPIVGGTPDQHQAVRSALLAFDEAVGVGRVRLTAVVFDDEEVDAALGRYQAERVRIALAPQLDALLLATVVRHELCHAIDAQEGLSETRGVELDALAASVLEDLSVYPDYEAPDVQRLETFARLCDEGPEVASLLAEPCPMDPVDVSDVLAWMSDQVWTGGSWFPESRSVPMEPASWQAYGSVDFLHVYPAYLGGEPILDLMAGDRFVLVAAYTGELVENDPALPIEEETNDLDDLELLPFDGGTLSMQEGWSDGPAIALAEARVTGLGAYERLVHRPGPGPWERVPDLCPPEIMDLFALDERVWYAWADDAEVVSWMAFTP